MTTENYQLLGGDNISLSIDELLKTVTANVEGVMDAATYDPTGVEGDAFDMENMAEGATNKIFTAAERTSLTNIVALPVDTGTHGFTDNTETTLSFDDSTYTVTLADAGAGWSYWRDGVKYTISGTKTVVLSGTPPTADKYYVYIDATDGTLTAGTTAWTLLDSKVPVALLCFNNALTPKYCLSDERHTAAFDKTQHAYEHLTFGTRLQAPGAISGYTASPASPTDANNTYALGETTIWDEDLQHVNAALPDDGPYHIEYRTGVATWSWLQQAIPFRYTAAGYIQWDNAGTMTQGVNGSFYNTYILATNNTGTQPSRFAVIHGQGEYGTLAAAQAASFSDLDLSGLQFAEAVALYKVIWKTKSTYTTAGKCRMAATPTAINLNISQIAAPPGLGTMSTQNDNDVAITGGSITGLTTLSMVEQTTPSNPASGNRKIFPKTDGWYDLDDTGAETKIGTGGGTSDTSWTGENWTSTSESPSQRAVEEVINDVAVRYADRISNLTTADDGKVVTAVVVDDSTEAFSDGALSKDSSNGWASYNLRTAIAAAALSGTGSKVTIELEAPSDSNLGILSAYIGESAGSGDFTAAPTQIFFSSSASVDIPSGTSVTSDEVDFDFDDTADFLVSVKITTDTNKHFVNANQSNANCTLWFAANGDASTTEIDPGNTVASYNASVKAINAITSTQEYQAKRNEVLTNSYSSDQTLTAAQCYGSVIYVTGAATITLPAFVYGMSLTVYTVGAVTVSVKPDASDKLLLDGVALDDGDKITNTGTAGDIATIVYYSADGGAASTNGWLDGGA